jgi:hypothetical protein
MANAVAAFAFHGHRGGPVQDLELDLRQAIHGINPAAFWHPTLNSQPGPHPLVLDNPFLLTPYRTAGGRWIMASGFTRTLAAKWYRFPGRATRRRQGRRRQMRVSGCYRIIGEVTGRRPGRGRIHHDIRR